MVVLLIIGGLFFVPFRAPAGELEKLRIHAGLRLFPAAIAADKNIRKKTNADGKLLLLIIYRNDKAIAEEMADALLKVKTIRGTAITVETASYDDIGGSYPKKTAALFLSQPGYSGLKNVISFGEKRQILVFSPFHGDVEKGVACGLVVSDMIEPYVNTAALKKASVRLKSFFLKVATQYD